MAAPTPPTDWRRILAGFPNFIPSGGIVSDMIADGAITTAKIANLAVTTAKLANLAVTNAKLALLSVDTGNLIDLAVTTAKLAANAVTTAKITDANVTTAKLAANTVTFEQEADAAGDDTTTSTSYVLMTGMDVTLTGLTSGDKILVWFSGDGSSDAGPGEWAVGVRLDAGTTVDKRSPKVANNTERVNNGFVHKFTATGSSHQIRVYYKIITAASTITSYANRYLIAMAVKR